jgi:hypothetical protein
MPTVLVVVLDVLDQQGLELPFIPEDVPVE